MKEDGAPGEDLAETAIDLSSDAAGLGDLVCSAAGVGIAPVVSSVATGIGLGVAAGRTAENHALRLVEGSHDDKLSDALAGTGEAGNNRGGELMTAHQACMDAPAQGVWGLLAFTEPTCPVSGAIETGSPDQAEVLAQTAEGLGDRRTSTHTNMQKWGARNTRPACGTSERAATREILDRNNRQGSVAWAKDGHAQREQARLEQETNPRHLNILNLPPLQAPSSMGPQESFDQVAAKAEMDRIQTQKIQAAAQRIAATRQGPSPSVSVEEIVEATGIPPSVVHRLWR